MQARSANSQSVFYIPRHPADGRSTATASRNCAFLDGEWFIDINGNGRWDEEDIWLKLGTKGDQPVVGDWDGDGKDDIGIFGPSGLAMNGLWQPNQACRTRKTLCSPSGPRTYRAIPMKHPTHRG